MLILNELKCKKPMGQCCSLIAETSVDVALEILMCWGLYYTVQMHARDWSPIFWNKTSSGLGFECVCFLLFHISAGMK